MSDPLIIGSSRHEYRVEFIGDAGAVLAREWKAGDYLVADKHLLALYPDLRLFAEGHPTIKVEPTEQAKSYDALAPVIQELLDHRFTKSNRLIAIGGGIVQDITAFTASILLRGVDWIFFPTNLLTQCDSCIGSKTSINFGAHKNQLGGFYPPKAVFIGMAFLDTLPEQEIRSGLGEMLHYFLVSGEADFAWAAELLPRAFHERPVLEQLIHRSLEIKKAMIERDEFDRGPRNVFNYGHSFGHALESATHYGVPHGIAVSFGMDLANVIAARLGLIDLALRNRIRPVLARICQGTPLDGVDTDALCSALGHDKKNEGREIKVILTRGIGSMFKTTLSLDADMRELIQLYFRGRLWEKAL